MLEHSPDSPPPLVAAPRHLRKRRMHTEIPDTLLVPGAAPVPLPGPLPLPAQQDAADQEAGDQDTGAPETADLETAIQIKESQQLERDMVHRRKRKVALMAVLFVAFCLAVTVLALLLG